MMQKQVLLTVVAIAALTLGGCGQQHKASTDKTPRTTKVAKKKSAATSTKKAVKKQSSSAKATAAKATPTQMNFAQLQKGNYSSLTGSWTQIAAGANRQNGTGLSIAVGDGSKLAVTAHGFNVSGVTVRNTSLTDNAGNHDLAYAVKNGVLSADLRDADSVAINWGITFYPRHTTTDYGYITGTKTNEQNLIVVWTSNNSATEVYAQNVTAAQFKAMQGMNLTQVSQENFTSLIGTWKNEANGQTIVVTNQVQKRPADSVYTDVTKGAVISGQDVNGQHEVLMRGEMNAGAMTVTFGYFANSLPASAPVTLAPKGIQISSDDDSDRTQDRMIVGAGQGGYAPEAYYRVH
ncbi:DUF6287 domain-containing protein [Lacticaseibacillus sharpeae]|uniref:Lipoprotein n=1 Tax=Lacticaseibacillus sharpeae JCM 1186 = DSM 20505 TaxID=1291052 RepID=A0A0R1ZL05_9LACO|nr:DUF6287 domain-containing protein [Lacticaseibacillus sharpeae]KRM55026.1 lipoprotein precursor [Lacticaseibacillus sharpeae JCM 1186 = DSM 20505]